MEVKFTGYLKKQLINTPDEFRKLLKEKILLIKENPYRYKKLFSKYNLFRVRFSIQNKELRLIYLVQQADVIILCLINRKENYKDLDKFIKKLLNML